MFKLLAMLVTFLLVALSLLALRQHRLELTSQSAKIYDDIRERNETLLNQRAQIAHETNPWTIATALQQAGISTGEAMQPRGQRGALGPVVPTVETDLVAPLLDGRGH